MHVRPAGVLFKRVNDIWVPTMSRSESGHSGKKVNETVNISVCLGDMEERENKETMLSCVIGTIGTEVVLHMW